MKTIKFFPLIALIFLYSCSKENVQLGSKYFNNDVNELLDEWIVVSFVEYSNNETFLEIPYDDMHQCKVMFSNYKNDSCDISFNYVNELYSVCYFTDNNELTINNQWGGTEVYDSTGWEEKIVNALNSVSKWIIKDKQLYLLFKTDGTTKYNALCLQRD